MIREIPRIRSTSQRRVCWWKYRDPEFALEVALLAGGIALYLTRNAMPAIRKGAMIAFGLVLVIVEMAIRTCRVRH